MQLPTSISTTQSVAGDAAALQPAAAMTPALQAEVLGEVVRAPRAVEKQELWLPGVLLAVILAGAALYVIRHIKKENQR